MIRLRSTWLVATLAITFAPSSAGAQAKAAPSAQAKTAPSAQTKAAPSASAQASAAPSAAPAVDAPEDRTRKLFEEGTADLNAGRFADAEEKLRAAWALKKSFDVAGNLGAALLKLGKHVEAARFLSYAADNFPVGGKPAVLKWVEELLADAVKEVVTLHISVNEQGAAVKVNGEDAGASPLAARTFAPPGAIVVEAHKDGFEDVRMKLTGAKGASLEAPLVMKAKGGTAPPGSNRLPSYIAFGAGGAGLLLGAITGGVSIAQYGDLTKGCNGNACPASLRADADAGRTLAHVATAGFVLAGVGAAVGVTLLLVPIGAKPSAAAGLSVGPSFVGVKGAF